MRNIVLFIILTFVITWSIEIPEILSTHGIIHLKVPRILNQIATFSPGIVAVFLTIFGQKNSFKSLIGSFTKFKVSWKIYLCAIFTGPIIAGIAMLLFYSVFNNSHGLTPIYNLFFYFLIFFFFSPFWEELGWRGYLLPLFLSKFNPVKSSLIMGLIWASWHLPIFFASNINGDQTTLFTFLIFISCFPLSIILTSLFIKSRGSVLICMLFHDGVNTGIGYFMGNSNSNDLGGFKICVILYFILAAILLKLGILNKTKISYDQK